MGMTNYVQKLIRLIDLEREAEVEETKKEIKNLSGSEREKIGRAILNLGGRVIGKEFGYKIVRYERQKPIKTDIEVGDLVLISKENPLLSNLFGTVVEKRERAIFVALDEVPNWALDNVRIDLSSNDITFKRQVENLQNLSNFGWKALRFFLKKEYPKRSHFLKFHPFNKKLNEAQKEAIGLSLGSRDFFLIHGPFGTGKTTTLAELILQEVKRGKKVLATAESNVAVDNLTERLLGKAKIVRIGHPSRITPSLKKATLSFLVEQHPEYKKALQIREHAERLILERERFLKPTVENKRGLSKSKILKMAKKRKGTRGIDPEKISQMAQWIRLNRDIQKLLKTAKKIEDWLAEKIIEEASVVLATNSSVALEFLKNLEFDVAVIDEASQATIPSVLIPISKAKKFILAGDHKQLPPTILNSQAQELSKTLFENLILNYPKKSRILKVQYRMSSVLMEFPSQEFYNFQVKSSEKTKKISLTQLKIKKPNFSKKLNFVLSLERPLVFVDTSKNSQKWESQKEESTSRENYLEATLTVDLIKCFLLMGAKKEWIGVITPYDDQVKLIKQILEDEEIEVKSVDGFQGREKEIIILSLVRSNKEKELGFLNDFRRLNVSLTRAKRKLIVIGDSQTLKSEEVYNRFINFCKKTYSFINF